MANPEHLAILKQGVQVWSKWRKARPGVAPDLSGANLGAAGLDGAHLSEVNLQRANLRKAGLERSDLSGAIISFADLSEADLRDASLRGADLWRATMTETDLWRAGLSGADLREANLHNANLSWADVTDARLDFANLSGARLSGADLMRANLSGADLHGADFTGALVQGTNFSATDLSASKGLEAVEHYGPSTIGIDTLYKSSGKIPEVFLRGCGVPDQFITYIGSLMGRPIEFYSCFISYSTKDQEFAQRLYDGLQGQGVRCWFAPHDIRGGRKIHEQIDEAIRVHDKLLLILSADSMASDWVQTEIAKARKREAQEKRQMLFPVALVPYAPPPHEAQQRRSAAPPEKPITIKEWELINSAGEDVAEKIREYFIPDFSNWKDHDSYQKAFAKLVADLKAQAG